MKAPQGKRILMLLENCAFPRDDRVRREARALTSAGYRVMVIAPASESQLRREVWEDVTVYRYRPPTERVGFLGYLWEYGYSLAVIYTMSVYVFVHDGFDIIHAHQPPDLFALIAAFYKLFGKKYVLDHHDLAPDLYEARFRNRAKPIVTRILLLLERFACRIADRLIATNQSYKDVEMERGGVPAERIAIVRNGPDLKEIFKSTSDLSLRKSGKTIIGYVGVMGTQDGVDNLLRAIQHLVFELKRKDVLCVLVGSGNALPELQSLCKELRITEYVHFTGWVDGQELVRRYLNSMDICVAPEPSDPYNDRSTAAKVMEYMAVGKPIVSSNLPEHRFTAGDAAVYARSDDEVDFARKIADLIDDHRSQKAMGEKGKERIDKELAWSFQAEQLLKIYEAL